MRVLIFGHDEFDFSIFPSIEVERIIPCDFEVKPLTVKYSVSNKLGNGNLCFLYLFYRCTFQMEWLSLCDASCFLTGLVKDKYLGNGILTPLTLRIGWTTEAVRRLIGNWGIHQWQNFRVPCIRPGITFELNNPGKGMLPNLYVNC